MNGHRVSIFLAAAFLTIGTMALAVDPLPDGWMGGNTKDYEVGVDRDVVKTGKAAATIKARTATPENFGTILQSFDATEYLGKRVRMSAFVKADKIKDWAGLWMRVDGEGKENRTLSFDNMQSRPIKGTLDWKNYEIVLDVPEASKSITFGILLSGRPSRPFQVRGRAAAPTTGPAAPPPAPHTAAPTRREPGLSPAPRLCPHPEEW